MLMFKIAALVASIPIGIWLGVKTIKIGIGWLRYWMKGLKPPRVDD